MSVWKIQASGQAAPLYLIDSRLAGDAPNPLCGTAGCVFFAYIPSSDRYQQVFLAYLDPRLPPEVELFEVITTLEEGFPTLMVHQLDGRHLQQLTLSFTGQRYEVVNTQHLPQVYE
ncbi:MAG: hypothetical protein F6J97_26470 [Leptolyngbya sp. SIO4C1]|nr:hypothetical protein [Leptolyngbya sp. SIO4C1]